MVLPGYFRPTSVFLPLLEVRYYRAQSGTTGVPVLPGLGWYFRTSFRAENCFTVLAITFTSGLRFWCSLYHYEATDKIYITTAVDPPLMPTKFREQGKDIPLQRVKIVDERYNISESSPALPYLLAKPFVPILLIETCSSMIAWALHT